VGLPTEKGIFTKKEFMEMVKAVDQEGKINQKGKSCGEAD
jgi:hypothetical protein